MKFSELDEESSVLGEIAMNQLCLSARAYDKIFKVSRTNANLECEDKILSPSSTFSNPFNNLPWKVGGWDRCKYLCFLRRFHSALWLAFS
jgi:hypothetical protein